MLFLKLSNDNCQVQFYNSDYSCLLHSRNIDSKKFRKAILSFVYIGSVPSESYFSETINRLDTTLLEYSHRNLSPNNQLY